MNRALSPSERWYWVADQVACINAFALARFRGALSPEVLREALDRLQARHPALAVRIETDARGSPRFVTGGVPPVPLATAGGDWTCVVEEETARRFDAQTGPLVRTVLLPREGGGEVVLIASHVVADGAAGPVLMRDLFRGVEEVAAGVARDASYAAVPMASPPAPEDRFPAGHRGLAGVVRMLRLQIREQVVHKRRYRPSRLRPEREVPFTSRRTRFLHRELDAGTAARLVERCRAEKVPVHGAVVAAVVAAVSEEIGGEPSIAIGSPTTLRPFLEPPVGEDVGVHVSSVFTWHRSGVGFWDQAREAASQVEAAVGRGDPFALLNVLRWLAPRRVEDSARFLEMVERSGPGNVTVSNLGRVDFPPRFGPLEVEAIHFGGSLSVSGHFLCVLNTSFGRVFWNFGYVEGILSPERAGRLADRSIAALRDAVA